MRRRDLLRSLLRRELNATWWVAAACIAIAACWCAGIAAAAPPDATGLFARMMRRADLAILGSVAVLGSLRIAQRTADDFRAGWTEPYFAAGGSRSFYGIALHWAVTAAMSAWFVVGAISFACAVFVFDDTAILLVRLGVLLPAGALLLTCVIGYVGLFAHPARDALTAVVIATILAAVPFGLVISSGLRPDSDGTISTALWLWNLSYPPPLTTADGFSETLRQFIYAFAATAMLALAANRFAGRRT